MDGITMYDMLENKMSADGHGGINITPQGKSTLTFSIQEIIDALIKTGKCKCWEE